MARYCPTCRRHFHGEAPPHSARHVSDEEHVDPVSGEPLEEVLPLAVGEGVVALRRGALAGHFTDEGQLATFLARSDDAITVVPRADWAASVAERVAG